MEDTAASLKLKGLHRAATSRSDDSPFASQNQDSALGICRICRGEGTAEEPLFFPCKCSGSIKYVHQDCLMEWLSHSQKKHCELCKTSFRFTKLYAPDMPQSLPVHVFLGHMAKYLFRNMLVWLRAAIAISVWLCWLPYFMRSCWSFLFWVSDEGFSSSSIANRFNDSSAAFELASSALGISTCPASPLLASTTTPASAAEAVADSVTGQNLSEFLIRILLGGLGGAIFDRSDATTGGGANTTAGSDGTMTSSPSSLLGDVTFLHTFTRNPTLNRALIAVLEGQIITVLVIVCFILVILVRDYVVQQQPEINIRAAFAAPANPLPPQDQLDIRAEDVENLRGPDESDEETLDNGDPNGQARNTDPMDLDEDHDALLVHPIPENIDAYIPESDIAVDDPETPGQQASVNEYLRIWRKAKGDPYKILEMIEDEGLEERLAYWANITRRSLGAQERVAGPLDLPSYMPESQAMHGDRPESSGSTAGSSSRIAYTPESDEVYGEHSEPNASGSRKGKEKASLLTPPSPEEEDVSQIPRLLPGPSRPRAVSDGPQLRDSVNPLANSSWSFAALRTEPESDGSIAGSSIDGRPAFNGRVTPPFDRDGSTHGLLESDDLESNQSYATASRNGDLASEGEQLDTQNPDHVQDIVITGAEEPLNQADEQNLGLVERVADFMYQDVHPDADDEEPPERMNDDPWIDIDDADDADGNVDAQPDDPDAAPGAGLDPEAVDDLEDFEGVMELIGMRGPIAGLFQNAIFCAVLVSMTILTCIFLPYNIGRVSVWILANPMRLVRLLFELSKLLQDAAVLLAGIGSWCALNVIDMVTSVIGGALAKHVVSARKASWALWTTAGSRVVEYAFMDFPMSTSEMQNFSAISHAALLTVKGHAGAVLSGISKGFAFVFGGYALTMDFSFEIVNYASKATWTTILSISSMLMNPSSWVIDLSESENVTTINPELAHWSGLDRFWAILAGYITLFFIGAMYLKRGSPFSRGNIMQAWEAGIIDTLHQASGIMKVIMVISIEMLVFPLYCGLLLDGALLPLFENTTFKSRMLFTYNYPLTSVFVHWFVGTGYMFHFALFVSMCRKIMRQGVLYFIRDPDDPEFHPVRDVLERNLTTQLRKILFSAFVYGALVIVCLGGVVWGLAYTTPNVLPVHYSSNEPVLEFPVDLLFYNFLMPLAVNFFKPGDGLHAMYTWWFRTCARNLRLTFFLFGERRIDEEGTLQLAENSRHRDLPWYQTLFLELDEKYRVAPKTWKDMWDEGDAKPAPPLTGREMASLRRKKARLRDSNQLEESGHFVRAPASDRIRIPKGRKVFLDVTESDERLDEQRDTDLYGSDQYQMVYIPPHFRARVFLFILFIWVFAAVTGVGFTIIPLVFGRMMFTLLIPEHIRTNDIYAFSIGVYVLGSLAWSLYHWRPIWGNIKKWAAVAHQTVADGYAGHHIASVVVHGAKLVYAYFFLLVVFPILVSTIMELYLTIPLHTYMYPPTAATIEASRAGGPETTRHTVRVIQSWTLGLLYLKLGARMVTTLFFPSRLAAAVRAILRPGWLHPDIKVLTRAFVIPGILCLSVAIVGPPFITSKLLEYGVLSGVQPGINEAAEAARLVIMYRQSYPVVALAVLLVKNTIALVSVFNGWTARIRDEAYLIGERLHNFGAAAAGARRVRGAWRAGGARL
ncbi:Fc.00g106860.m01.CDS01 [Cosmosporella sp. VM-42]